MLSYLKLFGAIRAFNIGGVHIPAIARYDYHKIFPSIILFILPRTKGIFNSFMVYEFPRVKIPPKRLRHYKAMLKSITIFTRHWVKEAIELHFRSNITLLVGEFSALPFGIGWAASGALPATARNTTGVNNNPTLILSPSFLTTIYTGAPYRDWASRVSSYITNLIHSLIIAQNKKVIKVVYH